MINRKIFYVIIFVLLFGFSQFTSNASAYNKNSNTGFILSDDQGNILLSQNENIQFIPASILKLLTSLAALKTFGEDYHFATKYFFDPNSKNLYIKGYGDPLFISEEINKFCNQIISMLQTKQIHHIILDHSFFAKQIQIPGKGDSLNPYDASIGALCANFNTILFKWSILENKFISGEPQTPLLPIFHNEIKKTGSTQGRILLSTQQSRLYPGLLIKYYLEKQGILFSGDILEGPINNKHMKENVYLSSFKMTNIIQKLLKYSNNFIANQIMLDMGAHKFGSPATLNKGIKALNFFSGQYLKTDNILIHEGSGLSRSNKISPKQMLGILYEFMPYYLLLNNKGNDYFKTGTLSDVRTRAGYISGEDNRLYPYVIMINKKNKNYESILKNLIHMVFEESKSMNQL